MSADLVLTKLEGVRQTGAGRWLARCPAHDDRAPSLSIRELPDGRVLLHDFAGCGVHDVLAAVGLDFDALYPPRPVGHCVHRERDPFQIRDILVALSDEAQIAAIVAARIAYGHAVDWPELDRMMQAVGRIANAADLFRRQPPRGKRAVIANDELIDAPHAA